MKKIIIILTLLSSVNSYAYQVQILSKKALYTILVKSSNESAVNDLVDQENKKQRESAIKDNISRLEGDCYGKHVLSRLENYTFYIINLNEVSDGESSDGTKKHMAIVMEAYCAF